MHPDLYLTVYRQQERELEEKLRRRLTAQERQPVRVTRRTARPRPAVRLFAGLVVRKPAVAPDPGCCATT